MAIRSLVSFFTLAILTRILGKKQVSQMTFFEYVNGITIGSIAATLSVDTNIRPFALWVGLLVWTAGVFAIEKLSLVSWKMGKYLDGEPTIVIMNGRIMEDALGRLNLRVAGLLEQLRAQGAFDISEVEFAVMETNGHLSVLKKSQYQPLTPNDMGIPTQYKGISTELIYDGVIVDQNLKQVNLDRKWLMGELRKRGIKDPSKVFLATLDTSGGLYVDLYDDRGKISTYVTDEPSGKGAP